MKKSYLFVLFLLTLGVASAAVAQVHVDVRILPPSWVEPTPPQEFHDIGRQAFHEGVMAARQDVDARLAPDVARHGEFRHPPIEGRGPDKAEYRRAFQRGYNEVFHHLISQREAERGRPAPPPQAREDWANDVPRDFRDAGRQGFHDGIEAARRDFADRKRPDARHHEEFRHPPVGHGPEKDEYRIGFQRGYDNAFDHMRNDHR